MQKIRVVAVDDHPPMLEAIESRLKGAEDIMLVGTALRGAGLLKLVKDSQADVVILDLDMPGFNPVPAVNQLHAMCPAVQVFVLTGLPQGYLVRDLYTADARGYMLKGDDFSDLAKGIRAVYAGERFYSQTAMTKYFATENAGAQVSDAERMLLTLVLQGYTNDQIAEELGLAEKTVRNNLSIIYQKLDVGEGKCNSRMAAVYRAIQLGLIDVPDRSDIHPRHNPRKDVQKEN